MRFLIIIAGTLLWTGCQTPHVPKSSPIPPVAAPQLEDHLLGLWELPSNSGPSSNKMTFRPNGIVVFQGNLAFLNPARWNLDSLSEELQLIFPETPDTKLQIFQLQVGDGVKALNRPQKTVTYAFDDQTWSLNVAGWRYAKPQELPKGAIEAEPVLR